MKVLKGISIFWFICSLFAIFGLINDGDSINLVLLAFLLGISPFIIIKLFTSQKYKIILYYLIAAITLIILLLANNYVAENNKMLAEYEASFHTIYFDTDGGKPIEPKKVRSFGDISNIRAEKEGYIFLDWLLDGQPIVSSSMLLNDVTLTANYRDPRPSAEQIANATTIDYVSLFKGKYTDRFFKITGEITQDAGNNVYHVLMTKKGTHYTDRIQIEIEGKPSEILMAGDIVSFIGEAMGNITYTTVLLNDNKIPSLKVYAENLKVVGHTD